jgi:cell division topological specificity factor
MSLLNYLRKSRKNNTASVAKERLQIVISHERTQRNTPDYLPKLKDEILAVLAKYFHIGDDQVSVSLERMGTNAVLELNITMPEELFGDK